MWCGRGGGATPFTLLVHWGSLPVHVLCRQQQVAWWLVQGMEQAAWPVCALRVPRGRHASLALDSLELCDEVYRLWKVMFSTVYDGDV